MIGIPHPESGELPRGYIVSTNPDLTEADVLDYLKDKVTGYKQLKGGVEFIKAIPKAPTGKILRRELKKAFLEKEGVKT